MHFTVSYIFNSKNRSTPFYYIQLGGTSSHGKSHTDMEKFHTFRNYVI